MIAKALNALLLLVLALAFAVCALNWNGWNVFLGM